MTSGTENHVLVLEDGTKIVKLEGNIFLKEDGSEMTPREAYNTLVGKTIVTDDGDKITFIKRLPKKFDGYNEFFRRLPSAEEEIALEKIKELNEAVNKNIIDILKTSKNIDPNIPDKNSKHEKYNIKAFDTREVYIADDKFAYRLQLSIAIMNNGVKFAYAKKYLEKDKELWQKIRKAETTSNSRLNRLPMDNIS